MRNFIMLACATIIAILAGMMCSAIQTSNISGSGFFSFLFGMVATISGGSALAIAGTLIHDLFASQKGVKETCF